MESPVYKRRRPAVACTECRRRKVKCDRNLPCRPCRTSNLACEYRPPSSGDQQRGPNTYQPSLNYPVESPFAPGFDPAADQFGDLNAGCISGREMPNWCPPAGFAHLDAPQREVAPANMVPNILPSPAGSGADQLYMFTLPPSETSTNSSISASSGTTKSSFLRISSFGPSQHYIQTTLDKMKFLFTDVGSDASPEQLEILPLISKCKQFSKQIKAKRLSNLICGSSGPHFTSKIPPRAVCDRLIHLYLHTFETVFRILHVPSFQQEYEAYWNNPLGASDVSLRKILLVLAIGTCFYGESEAQTRSLRPMASKWVHDVQQWLVHMCEISEIDIDVLQVSCLLLLARQTDVVASELIWISANFPLRIAIILGFHREPRDDVPEIPAFELEMRRRLWATILELSIQLSLDYGMPAPISTDDFDCQPPSNLNDEQISDQLDGCAPTESLETFTQSTIQITLLKTVPIRLQIIRLLNALNSSQNYQETLQLGSKLDAAIRSHTALIQSYLSSSSADSAKPTEFQMQLLDILTRRFLLALHVPFAAKAKSDSSFYFSRKVVTEISLALLSSPHLSQPNRGPSQNYSRLKVLGCGMFRHMLWQATAAICVELINDLTEDSFPMMHSLSRERFYKVIQQSSESLDRRIRAGDTSIEAYVLCKCALAQADAIKMGKSPETGIVEAAKSTLALCCRVLESQTGESGQNYSRPSTSQGDSMFFQAENDAVSWDFMI